MFKPMAATAHAEKPCSDEQVPLEKLRFFVELFVRVQEVRLIKFSLTARIAGHAGEIARHGVK